VKQGKKTGANLKRHQEGKVSRLENAGRKQREEKVPPGQDQGKRSTKRCKKKAREKNRKNWNSGVKNNSVKRGGEKSLRLSIKIQETVEKTTLTC